MLKITLWICVIMIGSTALVAQSTASAKPLSRCDVLVYQSLRGEGQHDLLLLFQSAGIGFDVSDGFVSDFRTAGASAELVTALRNSTHRRADSSFTCGERLYGHVLTAVSSAGSGNFRQAETEWRAAVAGQPANPILHLGLGMVLGLEKKWTQAEQEDRRAVLLGPYLAVAHSRLAAALTVLAYSGSREQRLELAHEEFERAVQLSPQDCLLRANFAVTLISQHDYAYADKQLQPALTQCPRMTFPMYVHANLLAEQGKRTEAIAQLRSALDIQPGNCTVSRYLASLLNENGEAGVAQEASAAAERVCTGVPNLQQKH